ncbi:neuropeptide FF receptor 2-like [Actinia tenebrosa]|uniref:Neuropeptide FF receptor 2-like n=1 Tax=Actinia tenebrosa TaxID=6105 RepID=A0A6P8J614_ACTTE|nr:neuropeptide FF receptor 2-like [Actinia tenebrosa]
MESKSDVNASVPTNHTADFPSLGESVEFRSIKISFYFLILFGSIFGNGMVAYVICSTRKMRTSSNYLILNLAICDILTPVISIPFDFVLEDNGYVWLYGGFLCKTLWPAATMTATSSALTLALISFDRYRLIMHPFKPRLTSKVIKIAIICIHIFAAIVVSPYASMLELQNGSCSEVWPNVYRKCYTVVLFLVQYGIPLPFMVRMYYLALKNLYKSTRKTSIMQAPFIDFSKDQKKKSRKERNENANRKRRYSESQLKENQSNKKATKMFITIVTIFAIFMLPNQLVWLWADFGDGFSIQGFEKAVIICWLFTYCNSVFNPVIFTIFSSDYRNGFRRILSYLYDKMSGAPNKETRKTSNTSRCTNISVADEQNGTTLRLPFDSIEKNLTSKSAK